MRSLSANWNTHKEFVYNVGWKTALRDDCRRAVFLQFSMADSSRSALHYQNVCSKIKELRMAIKVTI